MALQATREYTYFLYRCTKVSQALEFAQKFRKNISKHLIISHLK